MTRKVKVKRADVYAARARMELDRKSGRKTDPWIAKLAQTPIKPVNASVRDVTRDPETLVQAKADIEPTLHPASGPVTVPDSLGDSLGKSVLISYKTPSGGWDIPIKAKSRRYAFGPDTRLPQWTVGAIRAQEAHAPEDPFAALVMPAMVSTFWPERDDEYLRDLLGLIVRTVRDHQFPIEDLHLSNLTYAQLKRAHVQNAWELLKWSQSDLVQIIDLKTPGDMAGEVIEGLLHAIANASEREADSRGQLQVYLHDAMEELSPTKVKPEDREQTPH